MRTTACCVLFLLAVPPASAQWHRVPSPVSVHLSGVSFGSPQRGVITGYAGAALTTSDGGLSWQVALPPPSSNLIAEALFLDSMRVVAVGNANTLLSSTNAGATWTLESESSPEFSHYYGIARSRHGPSRAVWVAGGRDFTGLTRVIQRPGDGSAWLQQLSGYAGRLVDIEMYDDTLGWAVGDLGLLLRTTNGGRWWNMMTAGTSEGINSIRFFDRSVGVAVGTNGLILKSNDGGQTWRRVVYPRSDLFFKVWISEDATAYAVGHSPTIIRSTDRGETWGRQNIDVSQAGLEDVWFTGRDSGWAVGTNGTILRTYNAGGPTGVSAGTAELPAAFTVLAPFPNPANPSTSIPILLPRSGSLDVRLFDLLGREISVVLSGVLEGGTHTVTVDGGGLTSGIYFCRVIFEGEARTIRLLVLR